MRIIGGKYRGKKLIPPTDISIRPTTDRMRETLFNMLEHGTGPGVRGANILDLYAGSGALGVEALSRYAEQVTFVDNNFKSMNLIKENCALINKSENVIYVSNDCTKFLKRDGAYDIIFIDPPYRKNLILPTLENIILQNIISPDGIIVIEYASDEEITLPKQLSEIKMKKMGEATFSILEITN